MIDKRNLPSATITTETFLAEEIEFTNSRSGELETRSIKRKKATKLIPFIFMHIACIGVLFVSISLPVVLLCVALYAVRMFALTAGYHRYFSHRSFKTSRPFQFVLALLGTLAVQKGPL